MPSPIVETIYLLREHIAIKNCPGDLVILNEVILKIFLNIVVEAGTNNRRRNGCNSVIYITLRLWNKPAARVPTPTSVILVNEDYPV